MWRGSLRNPKAPASSRWDWGWAASAFDGTLISIGDVDGVLYAVERKGTILWIECKRIGEDYKPGQRIMHLAFSRKPNCSALLLRGNPDEPVEAQWAVDGQWQEVIAVTRDDVLEMITGWFRRANR